MTKTYLYHNLGLGDHIICNAIVRHVAKAFDKVLLFAKRHNAESVKFMFRDINVVVVAVKSDQEAEEVLAYDLSENRIRIGCTGDKWVTTGPETFDEVFYRQALMDFKDRWDGFKYEPSELFFQGSKGKYKFIHEDSERGYTINKQYCDIKDIPILRPDRRASNNIFAWDRLIAEAEEVHCINSSFLLLADSIPTKGKLYFHKYARNEGDFCVPKLRKDWTVIE
jgi:hypothetical protein